VILVLTGIGNILIFYPDRQLMDISLEISFSNICFIFFTFTLYYTVLSVQILISVLFPLNVYFTSLFWIYDLGDDTFTNVLLRVVLQIINTQLSEFAAMFKFKNFTIIYVIIIFPSNMLFMN
jgi:hypothetical protein